MAPSMHRGPWSAAGGRDGAGRLLTGVCGLLITGCAASQPLFVVNVPVVDLRADPGTVLKPGMHDPLQETQLLYGERVRAGPLRDGWTSVEATEQPEYTHTHRWQGYPGWVPSSVLVRWDPLLEPSIVVTDAWAPAWQDAFRMKPWTRRLPLGTRVRATDYAGMLWRVELLNGQFVWIAHDSARTLEELGALPVQERRAFIVRNAGRLIGDMYVWGGRSPAAADIAGQVTGVDCSGLTNLAYRAAGVDIPRDAHEQFLRAKPVTTLQPADLIFLSEPSNPGRITHVMLYAGNDEVIEGPGTGSVVRRIAVRERLGRSVEQLAPGSTVDGRSMFFGAYLP